MIVPMAAYAQFGYSYPPASQLLVGSSGAGTGGAATSPDGGSSSAPPLSPGGSAVAGGALSPGAGSHASTPAASCCDTPRPIITDPVSGQTVCSCQYDGARLALSSYPRLSSAAVGVYGTPYPSTDQNPYPSIGVDSSAFYSPLSNPYALKEGGGEMSAWTSAGLQPSGGYYPYDPTLAAYGYGAGYDLAARRKNATRESTATLKAWLNEHKKNPYPTKGEKIMLAIITKMTLTQVSTWFANARRRLKKENKMTWEPKNKTDDDDDTMLSDEDKDKDEQEDKIKTHKDEERKGDDMLQGMHHQMLGYGIKEETKRGSSDCGVPIPASKPKIWSLADTAACKTPPPAAQPWPQHAYGPPERAAPSDGGSNGFALPATAAASPASGSYGRYGGFAGGQYGGQHPCVHPASFPDVQTDTPPQTPPNMKVPSVANPLGSGGGSGYCFPRHQQSPQRDPYHNPHHAANSHQPNQPHHNEGSAAFKPFYKSSLQHPNGFVSAV
ncbi:hypothetical protein PYW08_000427 [Mythimna loreyi]|uniref:Uncharacterized protein n=1 Tax=Mythimna loreyi TaxID=667449 RepID=A0ACC2RCF9_9NEOP|nr:hypothetical protein PYW08_000427 [Mythimna loreyi]